MFISEIIGIVVFLVTACVVCSVWPKRDRNESVRSQISLSVQAHSGKYPWNWIEQDPVTRLPSGAKNSIPQTEPVRLAPEREMPDPPHVVYTYANTAIDPSEYIKANPFARSVYATNLTQD